jgi:phytol kinase
LILNNWLALLITFIIALVWLRSVDFVAARGWINSALSRKLIHIGTGPIFVLCWLFFNNNTDARWLAALVPFVITGQFLLVGTGILKDQEAVKAMSRSGNRQEILRGPLMYGIVFILLTLIFWRNSPLGITALMILCVGDGLADLIGSHAADSHRLPWSQRKSWLGSLAMFGGGWLASTLILWIFTSSGMIRLDTSQMILGSGVVAMICALVESLPFSDIDNLTVPLAALCVGYFIF